jgi:hypothetical protein
VEGSTSGGEGHSEALLDEVYEHMADYIWEQRRYWMHSSFRIVIMIF